MLHENWEKNSQRVRLIPRFHKLKVYFKQNHRKCLVMFERLEFENIKRIIKIKNKNYIFQPYAKSTFWKILDFKDQSAILPKAYRVFEDHIFINCTK